MTQTLGRVTPADAATYLVRTGWRRMGERNAGTVWTRPLDADAGHLFQPEDPTCADYALRMGEMLAALAVAEGRSEPAILADLCGADQVAGTPADADGRPVHRTDWMEPEYGLRRPELALVLDLAAGRVERHAFVRELQRLAWPHGEAEELADLVCECEVSAAGSAPAARDESPSIALIAAERLRHVEAEGWTARHDDRHVDGELARAAACYALPPDGGRGPFDVPTHWPFEARSWKPSPDDRVRELVKAASLIAAEIDRLLRQAKERADGLG